MFYFTYRIFGGPSSRLNFIDKNWICGNFDGFFFFFFAGRAAKVRYAVFENQAAEATRQRSAWRSTAEAGGDERESCARGRRAGHHVSRLRRIWKTLHRDQGEFRFPSPRPPPPPRTQTFGPIWLKGAKIGHTGAGRGGPLEDSGTHERSGRTDRHCDGSSFLASLSLFSPLFPANPKQTHTLNTT